MKNRTLREKILLSSVGVLLLGSLLYKFYIIPSYAEMNTLKESISSLEAEQLDASFYEIRTNELEEHIRDQEEQIQTWQQKQPTIPLTSPELLNYVGKIAEEQKVSIIKFKEEERVNQTAFWEIPFQVVLQGDYANLMQVMKSLDDLNMSYSITQFAMKVIDVDTQTKKAVEYTDSEKEYKWTSGNQTYVTGDFPLFAGVEVEEDPAADTSEESKKQKAIKTEEKVQIEFKLTFLHIDDLTSSRTSATSSSTMETGNDQPFTPLVQPTPSVASAQGDVGSKTKPDTETESQSKVSTVAPLTQSERDTFEKDTTALQKEIKQTQDVIYGLELKNENTELATQRLYELLEIQQSNAEGELK